MNRVQITINNDFHNSEIQLMAEKTAGPNLHLTAGQRRKARNTLCGISGCTCGGTLGERGGVVDATGNQYQIIGPMGDGGVYLEQY